MPRQGSTFPSPHSLEKEIPHLGRFESRESGINKKEKKTRMLPLELSSDAAEMRELNEKIHRLEDLVAELLLKNEALGQNTNVKNPNLARHFI